MIILLLSAFSLSSVSWILWKLLRNSFIWSDIDNIPGPTPKTFFKGNLPELFGPNAWGRHREISETYGSVVKIKGVFGDKMLYVFDPKALHNIIVKDQHIYEETDSFIATNRLIFGHGLLGTLGEQHRKQRKMLNPVFSVAHMRDMVPTFYDITQKLVAVFSNRIKDGPQEIECLSWFTRVALELVGQSGLGYSFDPLNDRDEPHPYAKAIKHLIPAITKVHFLIRFYLLAPAVNIGSPKFRRFIVDHVPWKAVHAIRDMVDLMHNTSLEIYQSKKKALQEGDEALENHISQGNDIISILIRANMDASVDDKLTETEVLGQMSSLIFAAMDTTSAALSRILWLLAQNQDVQDRLREEIRDAMDGKDELDYDELVSLPYMDAICREILRLYPPISSLQRTARQDAVLPLLNPVKGLDGTDISEIFIPKNTNFIIPIYSCNRNAEIWGPDANEFKPERWLNPLPESVTSAHIPGVYSNLMTFWGGGRSCIGFKFSQLEMKVVLSLLINKFRITLPKDKEFYWVMSGVASPYVVGQPRAQLPLIFEHV